jgi:hypothetical protein
MVAGVSSSLDVTCGTQHHFQFCDQPASRFVKKLEVLIRSSCVFCQNHDIAHQRNGFDLTPEELAEWYMKLQETGWACDAARTSQC